MGSNQVTIRLTDEAWARYSALAETRGVAQVCDADEVYLAKIALRADLRIESSVRYARLARHAPPKLLWAVAALVSPAAVDRATDRRSANAVPSEPRDAALEWLVPLLTEPALSSSGPRPMA